MHLFNIFHLIATAAILGSATAASTASAAAISDNLEEYTTMAVQPSAIAATLAAAPAATTPQNGAITAPSLPVPQSAAQQQQPNIGVLAYDKVGISDGLEFSPIPSDESSAPTANADFEVTPCDLNDANKNECIRNLFTQIVPQLKAALPQYGMPSIDPYFYRRGIFRYNNDGVQGGLLIKNMFINGISQLKANTFLSNFTDKGFIVKLGIEIPQIKANGQFKADVKLGGLRLVPKGPFNITIDNIRATILTDGVLETTEAGRRLKLQRLNANVAVGDARVLANGIFSDRNLNAMILNLVNENLPEIVRVGIPATREQWAPIFVAHINQFFANVPIDKLLLE